MPDGSAAQDAASFCYKRLRPRGSLQSGIRGWAKEGNIKWASAFGLKELLRPKLQSCRREKVAVPYSLTDDIKKFPQDEARSGGRTGCWSRGRNLKVRWTKAPSSR